MKSNIRIFPTLDTGINKRAFYVNFEMKNDPIMDRIAMIRTFKRRSKIEKILINIYSTKK